MTDKSGQVKFIKVNSGGQKGLQVSASKASIQ